MARTGGEPAQQPADTCETSASRRSDIVFGVATSAYQIEGATHLGGRGDSIWDTFVRQPGKVENGETGDIACDHYRRMEADVELMAKLGIPSYRFSISWARIFPDGSGTPNPEGLAHYSRLVDLLRANGISPVVTLNHWDLPQALQDKGGWASRETCDAFVRFSETMFDTLGDRVEHWITHNEPWVVSVLGYLRGVHAPGIEGDLQKSLQASHHMLLSHGQAVQAYRARGLQGSIGIALNLNPHYAETARPEDLKAAMLSDGYVNRWYLDPLYKGSYPADMLEHYASLGVDLDFIKSGDLKTIAAPTDFLGVNYYHLRTIKATPGEDLGWKVTADALPGMEKTDYGWGVAPDPFRELLLRLKHDYGDFPIFITENGSVYEDTRTEDGAVHDPGRIRYMQKHFQAAEEARAAGVDIQRFHVWSLLDNFEWAAGYQPRFGLVHVDYQTQERTPKDSAWFLRDVIQDGLAAASERWSL